MRVEQVGSILQALLAQLEDVLDHLSLVILINMIHVV
jgi:hypothetical protein